MSKGQLYSPSFLVCHLSLSKENRIFFGPFSLTFIDTMQFNYIALCISHIICFNCTFFESFNDFGIALC